MRKRLLIGAVITDCHIDFQKEILRGIISQAFKSSCDVAIIAPLHNFYLDSPHKNAEKAIFDLILSDRFAGFLYDRNSFYRPEIRDYIELLLKRSGKPVMLLDCNDHKSFETTSVDDTSAFEAITDHLIDVHGKKHIFCLTGPRNAPISESRLEGWKASMKKHSLPFDRSLYEYGDFWHNASDNLARRIITRKIKRPEAVVCGNDVMAIRLAEALSSGGIRVPEDIAVTGYDSSEEGLRSEPSITSYSRPNFQLGAEAFRRLYRIITGKICSRVPNEDGGIRLGRSCGCCAAPAARPGSARADKVSAGFENELLYGDMLFDITNVQDISTFADRLDNYTFLLYKMSRLCICLTNKFLDSTRSNTASTLNFRYGDEMTEIMAKSTVMREKAAEGTFSSNDLLPVFNTERSFPSAYYISPLHYNDNFFGYAGISFGKEPISFRSIYLQWLNYVNVALEHVRLKMLMSNTIAVTNRALIYDEHTGLLNRSGIEKEFTLLSSHTSPDTQIDLITIELSGIKKAYYQSGEEKCRNLLRTFAGTISASASNDEICGLWGDSTFCIITRSRDRAEHFSSSLFSRVKSMKLSGSDSSAGDFSVGVFSFKAGSGTQASDAVYKSTVNRVYTYATSENTSSPQFEKLCMLRSRIMKNPERPWKISEIADSLYLSKSYLQKTYKAYFNYSIIEEMIQFRIEKAKKLLLQTDRTVTDIARDCGYSSYNYFVRQFRSCEGCSPSDYRRNAGKDNNNEC